MEVILQTYYILLPIVATSLIGWVGVLLKRQKAKEDEIQKDRENIAKIRKANSNGIKLVLRYMLSRYHSEYMIQGKITYAQYKDWMDIFAAYRALGGNSIAMDWNDHIEAIEKCHSLDGNSAFEEMFKEHLQDLKK